MVVFRFLKLSDVVFVLHWKCGSVCIEQRMYLVLYVGKFVLSGSAKELLKV